MRRSKYYTSYKRSSTNTYSSDLNDVSSSINTDQIYDDSSTNISNFSPDLNSSSNNNLSSNSFFIDFPSNYNSNDNNRKYN